MTAINSSYGVTILRVVTGVTFLAHGLQKLTVFGLAGTAGFLASVGIPAAGLLAPVLIALEIVGGLALILGVFTRYAGIALALNMLVALLTVHLAKGFFVDAGGFELVLLLGAASLALSLLGSGALALESVLPWQKAAPAARRA